MISFGESYCKIVGFGEFLKLFKIALVNNKERDISMDGYNKVDVTGVRKNRSSLIMTMVTKRYTRNDGCRYQKNILIDFAEGDESEGLVGREDKNLWDYMLI
jgi:hypothetical protein